MEGFYQRTPEGTLLSPPPTPPKDLGLYDLEEVQQEYVTKEGDQRTIHLLVEGIHCAACVWLIEHTMERMPGTIRANVNLSSRRLLLRWDNSRCSLSQMLARLGEIGYIAVPFDPEIAEGAIQRHNRALLFRMAFAGFTMMNLLWISIALYSGADRGEFKQLFYWIGFALATPTLFYSGWPFLRSAITGLRNLHLTMDLPIAIGATTTWAYSSYVTLMQPLHGEVYFDTVVNFIFVILVGRFLESISKRHAVAATQRLLDLQPRIAVKLEHGEEHVVPIRAIQTGDQVLVRPGQKIPVDGEIILGCSQIDEAMLTGESTPITKQSPDRVSAGTINLSSPLTLQVTATLADTALGRIIQLVEEAQSSKAPIQCTADRIVPWFVAITLTLAVITFLFWLSTGIEAALMAATAVLIITCPCAFGLATPMAIAVASGQGARHGILVKNGAVLEELSHINHFVFDKTGTLTEGRMRVVHIETAHQTPPYPLLALVAAAERYSEHPIAHAITHAATGQHLNYRELSVSEIINQPGAGLRAQIGGQAIAVGSISWLQQQQIAPHPSLIQQAEQWEQQAITPVHVGLDGLHIGMIGVSDQIRADAARLIADLHQQGIKTTLLSGDRWMVARNIAQQLGIDDLYAEVQPADKHQLIRTLQATEGRIAMVGDGINDAPALIQADVGIAVGSGTDVSLESADIILMHDELNKILLATRLSRRTLRTIRQNISLSILYNLIMVPLAMAGFITPLVAAISMPISSLLVIANAARIRTEFRERR